MSFNGERERERADKIAKQAKEMCNAYWKSVEFTKECYELMKVIKEKLSEPGSLQSQD